MYQVGTATSEGCDHPKQAPCILPTEDVTSSRPVLYSFPLITIAYPGLWMAPIAGLDRLRADLRYTIWKRVVRLRWAELCS